MDQTTAQRGAAAAMAEIAGKIIKMTPFQNRGLSDRTIEALTKHGVDAPERLLFMTERDLRLIPGVGKASLAEILAYRARFLP
jgi:DNA-directed RNA polymerase alpha subunit